MFTQIPYSADQSSSQISGTCQQIIITTLNFRNDWSVDNSKNPIDPSRNFATFILESDNSIIKENGVSRGGGIGDQEGHAERHALSRVIRTAIKKSSSALISSVPATSLTTDETDESETRKEQKAKRPRRPGHGNDDDDSGNDQKK